MIDFKSDNFSLSEIKYKEIKRPFHFIEKILDQYFLDFKIIKIFQLDRLEINSENYKIILFLNGFKKTILLRKNKALKEKETIDFYLNLLINLKENDVKVSRVILSKNKERSVQNKGDFFSVFEFIEADYFKPSLKSFLDIALNIALMHNAFNNFNSNDVIKINQLSKKNKIYYNTIKKYSLKDFEIIRKIIKEKINQTEIDKLILFKIPLFIKNVKEIKKNKKKIDSLQKQVIHSDLHPHNILIKGNKLKAIIDFDGLRIAPKGIDVAMAVYRFGRQFFIDKKISLKTNPVLLKNKFIDIYNQTNPLSASEIKLLPVLIKDDFLKKLLLVLNGVYLENNNTWAGDLIKFISAFEEIDLFWPPYIK